MIETILLNALEKIEEMAFNDTYIKNIATKALTDYASAPKEGLRWVKAENELPKENGGYVCRLVNGAKTILIYEDGEFGTSYPRNFFSWLDESSAPESGGEEKELTVAQKVVMDLRIVKLKEQGATEADILLMEMVELNKKLYEQILDSNISSRFNQLAKKAIAFDNRPESGGEERQNILRFLREKRIIRVKEQNDCFELINDYNNWRKDFVTSVQSSDVNPVKEESKVAKQIPSYNVDDILQRR